MVGRCISYWNNPFLGDMLVFWGVTLIDRLLNLKCWWQMTWSSLQMRTTGLVWGGWVGGFHRWVSRPCFCLASLLGVPKEAKKERLWKMMLLLPTPRVTCHRNIADLRMKNAGLGQDLIAAILLWLRSGCLFQSFVKKMSSFVNGCSESIIWRTWRSMFSSAWWAWFVLFHLSCLFFHPLCIACCFGHSECRTYDDGTEPYISIDSITSWYAYST